jgi:hypothetical protein
VTHGCMYLVCMTHGCMRGCLVCMSLGCILVCIIHGCMLVCMTHGCMLVLGKGGKGENMCFCFCFFVTSIEPLLSHIDAKSYGGGGSVPCWFRIRLHFRCEKFFFFS